MEKKHVVADIEIIREGMDGTHMYVLEKGQVQVSKGTGLNKQSVAELQEGIIDPSESSLNHNTHFSGSLFGELAILYNCRRTATITTKTAVTLWAIERTIFQTVVQSAGRSKDQERFDTLRSVKDLNKMPEDKLRKIADCLEEEAFDDGQCIIKQVHLVITLVWLKLRSRAPLATFSSSFATARYASPMTIQMASRRKWHVWASHSTLARLHLSR